MAQQHKHIHVNAFNMNCVGHINHGQWTHPRDTSVNYKRLEYWTGLAKTLERGLFDRENTLPEELTQLRMGKIVRERSLSCCNSLMPFLISGSGLDGVTGQPADLTRIY